MNLFFVAMIYRDRNEFIATAMNHCGRNEASTQKTRKIMEKKL